MHAATLVRLRPTAYHKYSPLQLILGSQPNISHLRIFGCSVQVPIPPPNRSKMGPQRQLGIYVSSNSLSIIYYLEPLIGDVFTIRYANCHFDENIFPLLETKDILAGERHGISWNLANIKHFDP